MGLSRQKPVLIYLALVLAMAVIAGLPALDSPAQTPPGPPPVGTSAQAPAGTSTLATSQPAVPAPDKAPAERPALIFILDGSGSMWGRIDGKPKIVIAKKVLADMIAEIGPETDVGLVSYGHRREGDCADVETLVPPGPVSPEVYREKLAALNPKGKTPISQAIRDSLDLVRDRPGPVTLVLVSDGKETCGGDPCWLVEHLKRTVRDFRMQVVGFDVAPDETEQLECIAGAGEGSYYAAGNAVELEIAVRQLTEETLLPQGPALGVGAIRNGKEIKAQITILTQKDQDLEVVRYGDTERFNPQLFHLEPGRYEIRVTEDQGGLGQTLTRQVDYQGRNRVVVVIFEEGRLSVETVKNGRPAPALVEVEDLSGRIRPIEAHTREHNPLEIALPPGRYEVKVRDMENKRREVVIIPEVVIEDGALFKQVVDFPEGRILVHILINGQPAKGGLDVFDSGSHEWIRSADTSAGNPVPVALLPGEYDLKVVTPGLLARPPLEFRKIAVEPGGEPEIRAEFQEARLSVRVLINGRPGQGRIEVTESATGRPVHAGESDTEGTVSLRLVPGSYDIRASDTNVSASPIYPFRLEEGLDLRAGDEEELVFQFQEGGLILRLLALGGPAQGVFYVYPSASGEEIESGPLNPDREVGLTLEPGSYDIVVEVAQDREKKIIRREGVEVLAGFRSLVELRTDRSEE